MKSRCLSFCFTLAATVHEPNPTNQWMLQMWPSEVVIPQVCFKNCMLDRCRLCGTGGFCPVARFCAVVWVATFCLPQVLGDAEKRRQPCQWREELFCPGHPDWIWYRKQRMGFGKYVFIYVTFYLWLQSFVYRDPNTWCESIWTPKSGFFRGNVKVPRALLFFIFVRIFEATNNKTKGACKDWDIWRARIEIFTSDNLNWFFRE